MTDEQDNSEIPEEELSEEEKELRRLTQSFYSIRLDSLRPIEECIPAGYKLLTKRAKDKTATFLSRSATFISNEIFLVSGEVECLHTFSHYGILYILSDQDGQHYNVTIPVVQAYHSKNLKHYSGRCQKVWVEGDSGPSRSYHQAR